MRKKLSAKDFERLIEAWGVLERLSRIDRGTYYPIVTATGENPFALALGSPGSPVNARLQAPHGPVDLILRWKPKVEKPRDLMAEQALRRSASGSLAAAGKKPDSQMKKSEDQDDLGLEPSELDSRGNFELTVQNAPEGIELQDIRFVRDGSDDQPITPVMSTGEILIPDRDCDATIKSRDAKVQGRVTHRGASRAPRKQASSDEDSQEEAYDLDRAYIKLGPAVHRYCLRRCQDLGMTRDDADEASQDTWDRVMKCWHRMDFSRPILSWILKNANYICLDLNRKRNKCRKHLNLLSLDSPTTESQENDSRLADQLEDSKSIDPEDHFCRKQDIELIRRLISNMPENQSRAIKLCHLEGMSYIEGAIEMESSVSAFKSLLKRAMDGLREEFERKKEEFERNQ